MGSTQAIHGYWWNVFFNFNIATNLLFYIVRYKQTADNVHDDADIQFRVDPRIKLLDSLNSDKAVSTLDPLFTSV